MKSNMVAKISLLLWAVTIAVFAWFFIRGSTTAGTDDRTAIVLDPSERNLILFEMRGLLVATHGILEGANQGDIKRIAQAARAAGMAAAADVNPVLMAKLPLPFKTLGMSVHQDMDEIANAAEAGKQVPELLQMVTNTMSKCVGCHAEWQLKAAD